MKRIYANLESHESISYLKNYDNRLITIQMSKETRKRALNTDFANWIFTHNISETPDLGEGILCGVAE